jgi:hypothetical protein
MACVRCGNSETRRDRHTRHGGQHWRGDACRRRFTGRSTSAFSRQRLPDDVIALDVRWYVRFRLSYADTAEWLAERGCTPPDRRQTEAGPADLPTPVRCAAGGRSPATNATSTRCNSR